MARSRKSGGNIYKRPHSENWWLDYRDAEGNRVRESAKTTDETVARRILAKKAAAVKAERGASDAYLQAAGPEDGPECPEDRLIRLENDVRALKQRLAHYEDRLEQDGRASADILRALRPYVQKLAYCREAVAHAADEIGHIQSALVKLIALDLADDEERPT